MEDNTGEGGHRENVIYSLYEWIPPTNDNNPQKSVFWHMHSSHHQHGTVQEDAQHTAALTYTYVPEWRRASNLLQTIPEIACPILYVSCDEINLSKNEWATTVVTSNTNLIILISDGQACRCTRGNTLAHEWLVWQCYYVKFNMISLHRHLKGMANLKYSLTRIIY